MKCSTVAKALLLGLLAGITVMVTEATSNQITVRDDGVIFRVRRFDDERAQLYRLVINTSVTSIFVIRFDGRVASFMAGTENYRIVYNEETGEMLEVIRTENGDRRLTPDQDPPLAYACDECEEAWDVHCGPAISIFCELVGNEVLGTIGSQSVDIACMQFGGLCASLTAEAACSGNCVGATTSPVSPTPATPAPSSPIPSTPSPVTPTPNTLHPITPAPITPAPNTLMPVTPAPVTPTTINPLPFTPAPNTPAPITLMPATSAPNTPAPITLMPFTPAPITLMPDTPVPNTPAPITLMPVTSTPNTPAPITLIPDTPVPNTPAPITLMPYSPVPNTPVPNTPAPNTLMPVSPAPITLMPVTPAPITLMPDTPVPNTPAPITLMPDTPVPNAPVPNTPAPNTLMPVSPAPITLMPVTPAPITLIPDTPVPNTPVPNTPAPNTLMPVSPAPITLMPVTPAPITLKPDTPVPNTPAPITLMPDTPVPNTPVPNTPAPNTLMPVSPAPITLMPVTPAPTTSAPIESGPCDPNPCLNEGLCNVDPAGGHICDCASGFGGMACQTSTSDLAEFYIEVNFLGTWSDERQNVFHSAADRWSEVITNVPCGGSEKFPPGRLLINATLEPIDGPSRVLGSAGPSLTWKDCPTITLTGSMRFDIDDISGLEAGGTFENVILHEMGHVIGVGTRWGDCSTCRTDDDSNWKCPAVIEVYNDLLGNPGGTESDIIELGGGVGTECSHFDEDIFGGELMTGFVDPVMPLSKITAASLDDTAYIVNPIMVDPYTLPAFRTSIRDESDDSNNSGDSNDSGFFFADYVVNTTIGVVDNNGDIVDEVDGIMVVF